MKTKIVYVLVSTDKDVFFEQTLLSLISLRKYQPDAPVTLVVDNVTDETLTDFRATIKDYVNEYKVIEFDRNLSGHVRSRFIRTNLRNLIEGDYLCIDGDTIIADKLEDIDECPYEMGGIWDCNMPFSVHPRREGLVKMFKAMGFETDIYINGGVLYVKDTPKCHELFSHWNRLYKEGMDKCKFDQPHLAHANSLMNYMIQPLDGIWNCHIMNGLSYLPKAKIIHYFASNFTSSKKLYPYKFMDNNLYMTIKKEQRVNAEIMAMLENPQIQWNNKLEVNSGQDLDLLHSSTVKLIQKIYYGKPSIFRTIDKCITSISNIIK